MLSEVLYRWADISVAWQNRSGRKPRRTRRCESGLAATARIGEDGGVTDDAANELDRQAEAELRDWAGCTTGRARDLIAAVRRVAVESALGTIAGDKPVAANLTEHRLLQLQARSGVEGIGKLNLDEIAGVFRITPGQAKALDRTFHARFPRTVEEGLNARLASLKPEHTGVGTQAGWRLDFSDGELRDHAVRRLRRAGIQKNVIAPKDNLQLTVPERATNIKGDEVETLPVLGIEKTAKR